MTSVASSDCRNFTDHQRVGLELAWRADVFPLALAIVLGAGLAFSMNHAPADVWWAKYLRGTAFVTFLVPFSGLSRLRLMDCHGSCE